MRGELLTKLQSHLHFANLIKRIKGCPRQLQRWADRERGVEGGRGLVQCGQRPCLGVAFLTRYLSPVTEKIREIRCPGRAQGYIYVSQSVEFMCVCVTCVCYAFAWRFATPSPLH